MRDSLKTKIAVVVIVVVGFTIGVWITKSGSPSNNFGSVSRFSDYTSTTTRQAVTGAVLTNYTVLGANAATVGSSVALGSVVITGANTGIINIYDATTTGPHSDSATTTLASFPASTVAGTYIFDVTATKGILIELSAGLMPTSTITWRQN